jgi:osmotically-inducible protein OsmY
MYEQSETVWPLDCFPMVEAVMKYTLVLLTILMAGCSSTPKSADLAGPIRTSLTQAGYKDVSVSQDREKGVVTLTGHVAGDADKAQAEQLAKSIAGSEVVANQIMVLPVGNESSAKSINSDMDKAIENLVDATLIQNHLHDAVKYSVKNGVLTLTGDVTSQEVRDQAQQLVAPVPNVQQVVNEIQVKNQKATGTN